MRIKAQLVKRDLTGAILSESRIAKHAVVVDEEAGTSEVLASDTVEIDGILFSRHDEVFQVQFSLGGVDSKGVFHRNLKYPPAKLCLHKPRKEDAHFWALWGLDDIKVLDFEQIKMWLHAANGVDVVAQAAWNLPQMESQLVDDAGKVIVHYKRGSEKAILAKQLEEAAKAQEPKEQA
jgi:hypothetical protein